VVDSSSGRVTETKKHSQFVDFFRRLVKEKPLGTFGAVVTLLLLLTGILADFITPYGMNEALPLDFLTGPSAAHWLGTDQIGRDLLTRIIYGARVSVIVGLAATSLATFYSVVIGVTTGYIGGKFDLVVQRFVDAWMSLPGLIVYMMIISVVGAGMWSLIIVLGLGGIVGSRVIRGTVIGIKENVYVAAARAIGCSTPRVLAKHILPNIMHVIIITFSMSLPGTIMAEASLSFIGFGIPSPTPSWGGMLAGSSRSYMFQAPWMAIWPGLALAIVVYSINMFGDAMRDLLDPRLRGGIGRYGVKVKKEVLRKK